MLFKTSANTAQTMAIWTAASFQWICRLSKQLHTVNTLETGKTVEDWQDNVNGHITMQLMVQLNQLSTVYCQLKECFQCIWCINKLQSVKYMEVIYSSVRCQSGIAWQQHGAVWPWLAFHENAMVKSGVNHNIVW